MLGGPKSVIDCEPVCIETMCSDFEQFISMFQDGRRRFSGDDPRSIVCMSDMRTRSPVSLVARAFPLSTSSTKAISRSRASSVTYVCAYAHIMEKMTPPHVHPCRPPLCVSTTTEKLGASLE